MTTGSPQCADEAADAVSSPLRALRRPVEMPAAVQGTSALPTDRELPDRPHRCKSVHKLTLVGIVVVSSITTDVVVHQLPSGRGQDSVRMATLYIRDFPEDLQRRLRVAAALQDESMKDLVIRAVEAEVTKIERKRRT